MLVVESAKLFQCSNQFRDRLEVPDPQQLLMKQTQQIVGVPNCRKRSLEINAMRRKSLLSPQGGRASLSEKMC